MEIIESKTGMQSWADEVRRGGGRIGFVPTMGYLHEGHLGLMRVARRRCQRSVASIFVNPLQFGPKEDLSRYPRDLERDRALLAEEKVDVLYLPRVEEMYPPGFQTEVRVLELTRGLCGTSRPGHFAGVTTVVAKLFHAVKPHVAVFGEKDYQQLIAIRRMVADLDFDVDVVGAPIAREEDGLAMSSRNAYLSAADRAAALSLSRALASARRLFSGGEKRSRFLLSAVREVLDEEPLARVDYAELVDGETLQPVEQVERRALLALAVFIGRTRLIDNTVLEDEIGRNV